MCLSGAFFCLETHYSSNVLPTFLEKRVSVHSWKFPCEDGGGSRARRTHRPQQVFSFSSSPLWKSVVSTPSLERLFSSSRASVYEWRLQNKIKVLLFPDYSSPCLIGDFLGMLCCRRVFSALLFPLLSDYFPFRELIRTLAKTKKPDHIEYDRV